MRAAAFGDPVIPAPLIGREPLGPLSHLSTTELYWRLRRLFGTDRNGPVRVDARVSREGQIRDVNLAWSWPRRRFLEPLTADQLDALLALLPRRNDSTLTGPTVVLQVEVAGPTARPTVYVVVERNLVYNGGFHEWSGAERPVTAYRSRQRADEVAHDLSERWDPNRHLRVDGWDLAGPSHVVMDVDVDNGPRPTTGQVVP